MKQARLPEGPKEPEDPMDVQYYDHICKELRNPQSQKVAKFLEHDCIVKVGEGVYHLNLINKYDKIGTPTYKHTVATKRLKLKKCLIELDNDWDYD